MHGSLSVMIEEQVSFLKKDCVTDRLIHNLKLLWLSFMSLYRHKKSILITISRRSVLTRVPRGIVIVVGLCVCVCSVKAKSWKIHYYAILLDVDLSNI